MLNADEDDDSGEAGAGMEVDSQDSDAEDMRRIQ